MSYYKIPNLYKDKTIFLFKECYAIEKIHGCLHSDSLITMADNSERSIKNIKKGDLIKSLDIKSHQFINTIVQDVIIQPITSQLFWYYFKLNNQKNLICTEDHPILTTVGWVLAKDITIEHEIISY